MESPKFMVNGISIPIVQELASNLNSENSESFELLKRYILPEEQRGGGCVVSSEDNLHLPIIDMEIHSHSPQHMQQLADACENWGFFQIVNHGIPIELLRSMREVSREFFNLPLEERLECSNPLGVTQLEGYGQSLIFKEDQQLQWSDALSLHGLPVHCRDYNFWPQSPPQFREVADNYARELGSLILRLVQIFEQNLGIDPDTKLLKSVESNTLFLRVNYYSPCPKPDLAMGLCPHSDMTVITVLLQDDDVEGLQIRKEGKDEWYTVKPIPGALVVNIGDTLEVMTNGRYNSIEHRAITNTEKPRMSIVGFYNVAEDEQIGPLPDFIDDEHPPLYKTFRRSEFVKHYFDGEDGGWYGTSPVAVSIRWDDGWGPSLDSRKGDRSQ